MYESDNIIIGIIFIFCARRFLIAKIRGWILHANVTRISHHHSVSVVFCSYHIGPSGTFKDDFGRSRGMLMEYLGDVYISQCNMVLVNLGQILHTLGTCEIFCISDYSSYLLGNLFIFRETRNARGIYCISRQLRSKSFCLGRNILLVHVRASK